MKKRVTNNADYKSQEWYRHYKRGRAWFFSALAIAGLVSVSGVAAIGFFPLTVSAIELLALIMTGIFAASVCVGRGAAAMQRAAKADPEGQAETRILLTELFNDYAHGPARSTIKSKAGVSIGSAVFGFKPEKLPHSIPDRRPLDLILRDTAQRQR